MAKENKRGKRFANNEEKTGISKKKVFIVILVLLIIAGIGVAIFKIQSSGGNKNEEEIKEVSEQLLQDKEFEGRPVKNISLDIKENASYLKCDVENNGEKIDKQSIYIVFVKEDNTEIARFSYMLDEIPKNETGKISLATTTNLIDSYDFYLETKNNEENTESNE